MTSGPILHLVNIPLVHYSRISVTGVELQSPKRRCCVHDFSYHPQDVRISCRSLTLSTNKVWISLSGFRNLICYGSSPSKAAAEIAEMVSLIRTHLCPYRYIFSFSMDTYEVVLLHRNVGLLFQGRNCLVSVLFVKLLCYYFVCLLKYTFLLSCCFPAPVYVYFSFLFWLFLQFLLQVRVPGSHSTQGMISQTVWKCLSLI